MTGDEGKGPRRAWNPQDDATASIPMDDTSGSFESPARRGPEHTAANPFARPGSSAANERAPEPAQPAAATPIPAPVLPHSQSADTGSSPAPRRSALSSNSPDLPPADEQAEPQEPWWRVHRTTLSIWVIAGVVGAVLIGLLAFFVVRGVRGEAAPSPTISATPGSSSPSAQALSSEELLTADDLSALSPAATWSVTSTTLSAAEHANRPLCLSTEVLTVNPVQSLQRVLATADANGLAVLHRLELFADTQSATAVMTSRIAALAACGEVPVQLISAATVDNLAEQTFAITIQVDTDSGPRNHSILLTRSGAAIELADVTRAEAVPVEDVAKALARSQTAVSAQQNQPAPAEITTVAAVLPPTDPIGWLSSSDIPRVRSGFGKWSHTGPTDVKNTGTGCENMTLATESGPTERAEMTYVLSQDDTMPGIFGMDQLAFTFPTTDAAAAFTSKLGGAIASCKQRVNTATVTELPAVGTKGADGAPASSRIFSVAQSQGTSGSALFQVIVSVSGTRVIYTQVTVEDSFKFSDAQLASLATRAALRATQTD